jgi:collagen type I/II/III/V/XI/XXIV/XXVII alpha
MTGSTISSLIRHSVTLGTGVYLSPLTITPTGTIDGGSGSSGYGDGFGGNGGNGGTGLDAADGVVTNSGTIAGGGGGYGAHLGSGGSGGTGVLLDAGSYLLNKGLITGGGAGSDPGLYGHYYADGGAGADVTNSTLTNYGTILGGASGNGGDGGAGVNLTKGIVTNDGSIAGAYGGGSSGGVGGAGVAVRGGTLTNNGTITGGSGLLYGGAGVTVAGRGILTNSGTITGGYSVFYGGTGVDITNSALTNDGTITGGNAPHGSGGIGVLFHGGGALTDAGFIGGGNGGTADAVEFGTAASRLILDPGASFSGAVVADAAFSNLLELATGDGLGTTAGTLSGLGSSFTNFGRVIIDTGASWDLTGTNTLATGTTLTNKGTLTLFNAAFADAGTVVNDGAIVLDPSTMTVVGLTGAGSVTIEAGGMLEVQGTITRGETLAFGGSGAYLHLDGPGSIAGSVTDFGFGETIDLKGVDPISVSYAGGRLKFSGGSFALSLAGASKVTASTSGDGAAISVLCFRADTRILTPSGERPVQELAVGDLVRTVLGEAAAPIVWVGRREVDCARHPQPRKVWPVRVAAEAFGPGRPHADLFLSPDHAVYVGDVLIPVKHLINGSTIAQVPVDRVTYHHLELAEQDVLLAEGLPAESYLDMRDGSDYANRSGPVRLYPDYAARMWEAFGCARLIVTGPDLAAARALVESFALEQAAA